MQSIWTMLPDEPSQQPLERICYIHHRTELVLYWGLTLKSCSFYRSWMKRSNWSRTVSTCSCWPIAPGTTWSSRAPRRWQRKWAGFGIRSVLKIRPPLPTDFSLSSWIFVWVLCLCPLKSFLCYNHNICACCNFPKYGKTALLAG